MSVPFQEEEGFISAVISSGSTFYFQSLLHFSQFFCFSAGAVAFGSFVAEQMTSCINSLVLRVRGYDKVGTVCLQLWVSRLKSPFRNTILHEFFEGFFLFSFGLEITIKDECRRVNNSYLWV